MGSASIPTSTSPDTWACARCVSARSRSAARSKSTAPTAEAPTSGSRYPRRHQALTVEGVPAAPLSVEPAGRHRSCRGGRPPPPDPFVLAATRAAFPPLVGDGHSPAAFGDNSTSPAEPGLAATPSPLTDRNHAG